MGVAENEIDLDRLLQDMPEVADLLEAQDDAPVIRMINALFAQAARDGASDIHIEPFETHSVVRYRVDGTLRDVVSPRKAACRADLAHQDHGPPGHRREAPAAGRPHRAARGRTADRRARVHLADRPRRARRAAPLDKEAGRLKLERLGMSAGVLERLDRLIRQPHGIVLVTGPTGSGKTTTLYAALSRLDASTSNILTVEDPIEYDLPGISQTQVNAKIDMSFALALRAILRQDPDVIMIGEIRDLETAQIAVQASLTGHLVLATLHTNDAVSAVTRLTDMGVEPFLLASSLLGVLAQRLVRQLCPACKQPAEHEGRRVYHPVGCAACNHTGYSGRSGIHELFSVDDEARRLIHEGRDERELRIAATAAGMRSMREDGSAGWMRGGLRRRRSCGDAGCLSAERCPAIALISRSSWFSMAHAMPKKLRALNMA